jgi:hypothetical protein
LLQVSQAFEAIWVLTEPAANCSFTGVTERRIANVVGKAGSLKDGTDICRPDILRELPALFQLQSYPRPQTPPNAGDL